MNSRFLIVALLASVPATGHAQDLPPGPGSEVLARACTVCHRLDLVAGERHDAKGWQAIVEVMINNGAALTPDEEGQVVAYLAKTLPP